jgi:hypothetical protein
MIATASADKYEFRIITKFDNIIIGPSNNIRRYQPFSINETIQVLDVAVKAAIKENTMMYSDYENDEDDDDNDEDDDYEDDYIDDEEVTMSGPHTTATVVEIESRTKVSVVIKDYDDVITVHIPDIRRGCNATLPNR